MEDTVSGRLRHGGRDAEGQTGLRAGQGGWRTAVTLPRTLWRDGSSDLTGHEEGAADPGRRARRLHSGCGRASARAVVPGRFAAQCEGRGTVDPRIEKGLRRLKRNGCHPVQGGRSSFMTGSVRATERPGPDQCRVSRAACRGTSGFG